MSEDAIERRLAVYEQEQANKPFGNTDLVSGRALAPYSEAGSEAAYNLLCKAERALELGDLQRMKKLVDRAVALPYDKREETAPAANEAGMLLFNDVVDVLELSAEGDSRWLDAAIETLSSTDGWGQAEMRRVLLVASQDYEVERGEARAIVAAVADVPERAALMNAELPSEELAEAVTSVLRAVQAYGGALDDRD